MKTSSADSPHATPTAFPIGPFKCDRKRKNFSLPLGEVAVAIHRTQEKPPDGDTPGVYPLVRNGRSA